MKIINLFPLTIVEDTIILDEAERKILVTEIERMKGLKHTNNSNFAWTGDTKGQEFLFSNDLFKNLANKISKSIINYLEVLEINCDLLDIYYQRSWSTYSETEQKINFHTNSQSNISFA